MQRVILKQKRLPTSISLLKFLQLLLNSKTFLLIRHFLLCKNIHGNVVRKYPFLRATIAKNYLFFDKNSLLCFHISRKWHATWLYNLLLQAVLAFARKVLWYNPYRGRQQLRVCLVTQAGRTLQATGRRRTGLRQYQQLRFRRRAKEWFENYR